MNRYEARHDGQDAREKSSYDPDVLFPQYRDHPTEALRNEIALRYLHIARIIAMRFSGKGVEYDDLYQVASLALVKAVERFDPEFGVQFQSYATPKMVGEVKNYFRDKLHALNLPRKGAALVRQIEQAKAELSQSLMRSPTLAELVEHLRLPEADVTYALAMRGAMYPGSLDAELDDGDSSIGTFLGADDSAYTQFELSETTRDLLERLDETGRRVLTERYFNERSQREVADILGVSQMTVSRVERKALARVRQLMTE